MKNSGKIIETKEIYVSVYDKEDTYNDDECLCNFDTEDEAREFVLNENAGYGYEKLFYKIAVL